MSYLFFLPFDHRSAFAKGLLGYPYPRLTPAQSKHVCDLKSVVFDAFLAARKKMRNPKELAILIDEEFGASILKAAKKQDLTFALSVEKSGQTIFNFEYGSHFGKHLLKWRPTYAKALVRYDVTRVKDNVLQRKRLKILFNFCKKNRIGFLLEVLLIRKGARLPQAKQMIREMQLDGITPTIWKLEGFQESSDWQSLRALTSSKIIMLGRGEERTLVEDWIRAAVKSRVVSGMAIGRTVFFKPLTQYRDRKINRRGAVRQIAKNFIHFSNLWRKYERA